MASEVELSLHNICNYSVMHSGTNSAILNKHLKDNYNTPNLIYKEQERPDILLLCDNFIYGIEHFGYDDSAQKKGSKMQAFISKKEKDFQNNCVKKLSGNSYCYESYNIEDETGLDTGYKYFVDNFLCAFDKHYDKIDAYKENIKDYLKENNLEREIKIYFLTENFSPFSPICNGDDRYNGLPYIPVFAQEVQKRLLKADLLDGIIMCCCLNSPFTVIYSKEDCVLSDAFPIIDKSLYQSLSKTHDVQIGYSIKTTN